jgi:hypothetical protein
MWKWLVHAWHSLTSWKRRGAVQEHYYRSNLHGRHR